MMELTLADTVKTIECGFYCWLSFCFESYGVEILVMVIQFNEFCEILIFNQN